MLQNNSIVNQIILFYIIINIFNYLPQLTESLKVRGKCAFPGKPYMSKLEPDNKLYYEEGEEVTYECIEYLYFVQTRKCERGRWTGNQPRCGENAFTANLE